MRRRDDAKEQRIKEAVIDVVLAEGFGGASVSKIAKRAGISPATLYIYHENKESMLQSIYVECAEEMYAAVLSDIQAQRDGRRLLANLIENIFRFATENEELFGFIEQFASSPALTHNCEEIKGFAAMMKLIREWQATGILKPYDPINIYAILFEPVKMLAAGAVAYKTDASALLRELIRITQETLLIE